MKMRPKVPCLMSVAVCAAFSIAPAAGRAQSGPPLYDDLGAHRYDISTEVPEAQAYFDQGMRLYYAFNHVEAIRAFNRAEALDPTCAMCAWGEALARGPNINLPMSPEVVPQAPAPLR